MKFSHSLLKKLLPKLPPASKVSDVLNMHSFEVESVHGDVLDIKLPANRYSDASSHLGIARELSASLGLALKNPIKTIVNAPAGKGPIKVRVEAKDLCRRYSARYFELKKVGSSPTWLKKALNSSGVQSINAVVDAMNYAMLVTGQPLHAFDSALVDGALVIRRAKKGEKITTLDDRHLELSPDVLLIADEKKPLAVAGIKGGKGPGVTGKTKSIIVEAANFDPTNIFKSSRALKLQTDASLRFAHDLSPALVGQGMDFVTALLLEMGAKLKDGYDFYPKPAKEKIIKFELPMYEKLVGARTDQKEIKKYFTALGFEVVGNKVHVPAWRTDVSESEDLVEELARFLDYGKLKSEAPRLNIKSVEEDAEFSFSEKTRELLSRFGFDEVYNSSFYGEKEDFAFKDSFFGADAKALELENPIAEDRKFLRRNLSALLVKDAGENSRFFNKVRIFELGKTFASVAGKSQEKLVLGLLAAGKKDKNCVLELKGAVDELLRSFGVTESYFENTARGLKLIVNRADIGFINSYGKVPGAKQWVAAAAEVDAGALLKNISEEHEFKPLPKYPEVVRDISFVADRTVSIGDIAEEISDSNAELIDDVDLLDEYWDEKFGPKQSLTFRIVFRSDEKTLSDEEVNSEMQKIIGNLREKFGVDIR